MESCSVRILFLQVVVYCGLTDQECRYLARSGNTEGDIVRPNTIYECLKSFRRLHFDYLNLTDESVTLKVDKGQAKMINTSFLVENPQLKVN